MKKSGFIVLVLFVCSATRIQAQGFHLGIKAGTNISYLTGRSFSEGYQWNIMVGAFAELNVTKKWGVQPEVLFSQGKTQTSSDFNTIVNTPTNTGIPERDVVLNYLSFPILLTFRPIPILSLQAGPQFGILMNTNQNITTNGANAFKSGNFAIAGGAQVNLGPFKAGARYVFGLTNIDDVTDVDTWNNRTIQIYVGLRIF